MGMFSYICSLNNKAIRADESEVVLYFIKKGIIQEIMSGPYNSYGSVDKADKVIHKILLDGSDKLVDADPILEISHSGDEWVNDWDEIVDIHFNEDESSGIHAIIGEYNPDYEPTIISQNDPDQGWGKFEDEEYDEEDDEEDEEDEEDDEEEDYFH
jgi:hypothetical protein